MKHFLLSAIVLLLSTAAMGQKTRDVHYDETKVPDYCLPDLMTCKDGTKVNSANTWETKRRPEVLNMLSELEYGRTPKGKIKVRHEIVKENPLAINGKATCRQVRFVFSGNGKEVEALLLLYIPNRREGKVPVFIGYNFNGNQSTTTDEEILFSPSMKLLNFDESKNGRGAGISRFEYEMAMDRGYAVATMCYNDICPDKPELQDKGILALFKGYDPAKRRDDEWQSIGAWAWGSSRIVDYIMKQKWADKDCIALQGHSRQGKAALWAGAQDKRIKVVISNDSGCGGAALSMRAFGETIARITHSFPHWFCRNFNAYADKEENLPFDQHALIALIAPRHVYVTSAEEDLWADPKGEFLATAAADGVYELYGMKGLGTQTMPKVHQPIMHDSGYHIRAGVHDVTRYDWECYLDFCDKHFK